METALGLLMLVGGCSKLTDECSCGVGAADNKWATTLRQALQQQGGQHTQMKSVILATWSTSCTIWAQHPLPLSQKHAAASPPPQPAPARPSSPAARWRASRAPLAAAMRTQTAGRTPAPPARRRQRSPRPPDSCGGRQGGALLAGCKCVCGERESSRWKLVRG